MDFHETRFFVNSDDNLRVETSISAVTPKTQWPIAVRILDSVAYNGSTITMHMSEINWIAFKNSVLSAHERWEKERANGTLDTA